MTSVTVEIDGSKELEKEILDFRDLNNKQLDAVLSAMAQDTQKQAIASISTGTRRGRIYKRRSIEHQASAPGELPKTDTGQLVRNIFFRKNKRADYSTGSKATVPYGFWLEFGTRKMAKRPWLRPAADTIIRQFEARFGRAR